MGRLTILAVVLLGCLASTYAEVNANFSPVGTRYVATSAWKDDEPKGGFYRKAFAVCPDQYAWWRPVTSILICQDPKGFVTGLQYFNEHPTKHFDPMTVCLIDAPGGKFANCTFNRLPMDPSTGRPATITSIKVGKVPVGEDWRVNYMFFGFSLPDGGGIEVGTFNGNALGVMKVYQWYQDHKPGFICGLNGFYSWGLMCDKKTGYLQFVKPCYSCSKKPKLIKAEKAKYTKVFQTIPVPAGYLPPAKGEKIDMNDIAEAFKRQERAARQALGRA